MVTTRRDEAQDIVRERAGTSLRRIVSHGESTVAGGLSEACAEGCFERLSMNWRTLCARIPGGLGRAGAVGWALAVCVAACAGGGAGDLDVPVDAGRTPTTGRDAAGSPMSGSGSTTSGDDAGAASDDVS